MWRTDSIRRQKGVASVEAILLIPFVLFFLVLIFVSLRLALVKEHNIIEARTSAWRNSMFNQSCQGTRVKQYTGQYRGARCVRNNGFGQVFVNSISGGRYEIQFAGIIRSAGIPAMSTATSTSEYSRFINASRALTPLTDSHTVDARAMWELSDMPAGYTRVLPSL